MSPARGYALAVTIGVLFTAQKLGIAYCTRESLIPEHPIGDDEYYQVFLVDSLTTLWIGALMSFRCVRPTIKPVCFTRAGLSGFDCREGLLSSDIMQPATDRARC